VETREAQFERRMVDALRKQVPVKDLPGVRIAQVRQEPERPFDVSFELASGKNRILVFAENENRRGRIRLYVQTSP
jgi:hypothetical protein